MATDGPPIPPARATAASTAKIVVATTVALSFISFWRGAAIVLSDLASTMFYIGGIVEQSIGPAAPWFVIAILVFGFAIRSVYMESCSMFVRGGVYVVVRDSMGPGMAKLSVSALVVDYILTGPISSVSAGHYFAGLINEILEKVHRHDLLVNANVFAMVFGILVTGYFWRSNIRGVHESSGHALRIMQITTVMVVMMLIWCMITLIMKDNVHLPPAPIPQNLKWGHGAMGWIEGTFWSKIAAVSLLVAFGHSLLAMSGFETLAQVYREIKYPKLKNLRITANLVCIYALVSTGLISLFAVMIIPDDVRLVFKDNLLGGLTNYLVGPPLLTFGFHVFVVIVGTLILSGAVNASIIGANGVLNRVAEDGVLLDWFRRPHRRFGTTYNIINMIAILQSATIVGSQGDVLLLGEAYAFGVTWSFFLKGLGVLALRFQRKDQEYKFPLNMKIGGIEIPIGLGATVLMLFFVALANLFSKEIATIYGVSFTLLLFTVFMISERINRGHRDKNKNEQGLEQFNLEHEQQVEQESVHVRPGCVLVAVRGYGQMDHLKRVLEKTNLRRHDIVVMSVRPIGGSGEYELSEDQIFTSYEQELFSHVVSMAEKQGKHVELLVVPGLDPFDAMVQTAAKLQCSRLVTGVSATMVSDELARRIGQAWERLPEPKHAFSLEIIKPDRPSKFVNLGPHPPRLWPEDVDRVHGIWLELSERLGLGSDLHHRDVVGVALRRMEEDLQGEDRMKIVEEMKREMGKG
jgi:amino acid transporter